MKFKVIVQPAAQRLIDDQVNFIAVEKAEPQSAALWLSRVNDAIASLDFMPMRCSVAPESRFFSETIYMLPVDSHLILFSIDEDAQQVNVLSFRAGRELPRQSSGEE
jgi:plasmid stabilization system protein ParE